MISEQQLPELVCYKEFEKAIPLTERFDYSDFVSPNTNIELPVHRWFRFKESFSAGLLREILENIIPSLGKKVRLLDPFCGVGTSLLAAQEMSVLGYDIDAVGIEQNLFIAFTAATKIGWPAIETKRLLQLGDQAIRAAEHLCPCIPPLSSLTTGKCISRYMSRRVLAIRDAIQLDGQSATHNALLLGLASVIEQVSKIRKDGRALRIVQRPRTKLLAVLRDKWADIARDVDSLRSSLPAPKIPTLLLGDGRNPLMAGIEPGSIDLVLTSPPYPNNIDYYEVYKLELWLLGFIRTPKAFLDLRRSTFYSHPRCANQQLSPEFIAEIQKGKLKVIFEQVLKRLETHSERWRQRILLGYFSDMWISLREQYQCLRKNGYAVIVVGNSLHGASDFPYVVPTDIAVSIIGQCLGFKIEQLTIARPSKRRLSGNHFLRESLIIMKKINE